MGGQEVGDGRLLGDRPGQAGVQSSRMSPGVAGTIRNRNGRGSATGPSGTGGWPSGWCSSRAAYASIQWPERSR
ncbi:hypothetical protein ACFQ0M_14705 [Kitasatospora aburaviensis]